MRITCRPLLVSTLASALAALPAPFFGSGGGLAHGQTSDPLPTPHDAVSVVRPERGFIDDAFAISLDSSTLYFVNTDGASWATLRAVGLPAPPAGKSPSAAPAPAPVSDTTYPALRLATAKASAKTAAPSKAPVAVPPPPPPAVALDPGKSLDVLTGLPLSVIKVALLPEDRVLFVTRDLDTSGVVNGTVYSLRSHNVVPVPGPNGGSIGPATDIVLGEGSGGPVIVAVNQPTEQHAEYRAQVFSAATLRSLGQHSYRVHEGDGRISTAQGNAMPLYFIDNYQTLVAKHDGFYDKKKDLRQPDFLAFIDVLTGKLRRSQDITDPAALLELARFHKDHNESVFPYADPETQKLELFSAPAESPAFPSAGTETRVELRLPRPASQYDGATLHYQQLRRDRLLFSLTVDPVNEQAVAQHKSDPDDIDFYVLDPNHPAEVRRVKTIPGQKRPSAFTASPGGRLVLLRKHKNFPRGGTDLEVYDLNLDAAP